MAKVGEWITRGFDSFRKGTFGNAGQNLYVSRAGVLQRIFQYDLNQNGYLDIVFCDSQNHWEATPAYIYEDPLGKCTMTELPSDGSYSGAAADLTGNGYDDLILGMRYNGVVVHLNAFIYYGCPEGYSERRHQKLPVPYCTAVAAGDFNGDGKVDVAFLTYGKVRIFYQTELGIEARQYIDLNIEADQIAAGDLDGDGLAELIVRKKTGETWIYWGGPEGIREDRHSKAPVEIGPEERASPEAQLLQSQMEAVEECPPLVQVIYPGGQARVSVITGRRMYLVSVDAQRRWEKPLVFECENAMAVAAGDINGDGHADLVIATRQAGLDAEVSWIYWGGPDGWSEQNRTAIQSRRACDVAVGDLNGNGYDDIVLCQGHTGRSFTTESLIYRGGKNGIDPEPVRLGTEDTHRVFLIRQADGPLPKIFFVNHYTRDLIGSTHCSIYYGGPDGYSADRRELAPGWGAVEALYCDVNDDGRADLVVANCAENSLWLDPGSYVLLNSPEGFRAEPSMILPTRATMGVCCADLNRDGYLDLIFGSFVEPDLLIFYGTANGFDVKHPERIRLEYNGILYDQPRWIYLADLNNDGWLDLVIPQITYDRSFILWGGPEGFSFDRCQVLSVWRACSVRAADLTGNGYLDLVIGGHMPSPIKGHMPPPGPHESFVYIYWNGPEGLSEQHRSILRADGVNSMAIADFNRDGMLDLFVGSYHNTYERDTDSFIYWNRRGIGFRAADCQRLFTHSVSGSIAADLNEDGWPDLVVANHKIWGDHQGYSSIWWNGPEGFSSERTTNLPTNGPHGITAVEPGNIMDRGPEEYYLSEPYELPANARIKAIDWESEIPAKTWVKGQLRFAPSRERLSQAYWQGPNGQSSWFAKNQPAENRDPPGRWVQYRLALGAVNSLRTPRITAVKVTYEY